MKKIFTLLCVLVSFLSMHAQNGDISGKLTDENGEGIPFANVIILDSRGVSTGRGTTTDLDGNYSIKPLTAGRYDLQFSYVGYTTHLEKAIVVSADKSTFLDIKLKPASKELKEVEVVDYKVPLIDPGQTSTQNTVTSEEIADMATKNVTDIAATTAGVFQADQGGGLNIKGGRGEGTQYYVDGIKVEGTPTVPASSIEQLEVITGGIPAKYGDVSAGIVNITTKGPPGMLSGGAEVQTTEGLDAYGYTLVDANLAGPLWKNKKTKRTIIGFNTTFEYIHQLDPNPSAIGVWQVRQNVLDSLQQYPLILNNNATGFNLRSAEVTDADMYKTLVKPNTQSTDFRGAGKISIQATDNINVTIGGTAAYNANHLWVDQYTLFNPNNNPLVTSGDYKGFIRFTHNIQAKQSQEEGAPKKASAFQNAYYSVQVDYEKVLNTTGDQLKNTNPFDYSYIGKFVTKRTPTFTQDTFAVANSDVILRGWKQNGFQDTAITFQPTGTVNPYGTAFTTQYYQLLGAQENSQGVYEVYGQNNENFTTTLDEIQANQGLINGTRSNVVNNIWFNTGRDYDGISSSNTDQYSAHAEGAFDILKPGAPSRNKHSIEFGIDYEQRVERGYSLAPLELWQRARQLMNLQLTQLDRDNPILLIDGKQYNYNQWVNTPNHPAFTLTDTILFNYAYVPTSQEFFDKNLREALGEPINSTNIIDIDALNPNQLSLNMFSPDELLANGASIASWQGYNAYGKVLTSQPNFDDYWTKVDANGNYVRGIPAFSPIYTDAYISDRFYFKDLTFNVGLRFDRYDANQKVLIDPYTLYPIYTAGEATALEGGAKPADIGANYDVYVDNSQDPKEILGYRNGSNWYDKYGNLLANGLTIADETSTGTIQPYLKNPNESITTSNFNPTTTFTDFKPEIIPQPRLQFSFNLTDRALFFAHYDILVQRPTEGLTFSNPAQYTALQEGGFLNGADLQPQKTVDYTLGFKQRVSNTAAFTLSAFYREFRDQIQITNVIDAYPRNYETYQNIDFGTTKGFELDFDLRRTSNFSLKANYTLQFADGTGSNSTSQLNLVNANQPNFRVINPLDYDSRHLINLNATYSFAEGKDYNGPVVKNKQILSNTGITFQLATRSGTPYTAQSNVTAQGLQGQVTRPISEGSINGSRLPWYFRLNMRLWKDFTVYTHKKHDEKKEHNRQLDFEVYLQIQNLLNTKNVLAVYRYTGVANTDGYLNDPSSVAAVQASLNPQAYKDQYAAEINAPENYSLPRRIYLGVIFSF